MRYRVAVKVILGIALLAVGSGAQAGWRDSLNQLFGQSGSADKPAGAALDSSQVAAGLKQALAKGAGQAVTQLGQRDGFWGNKARRIGLPGGVQQAAGALKLAGYGPQVEQFQLTMNRAAEQATGEVGDIVQSTIEQMTVQDAVGILKGPSNAATQYLRTHSSQQLFSRIEPIVAKATANTGVTAAYKNLAAKAGPVLALSGSQNLNLDAYVTRQAMDGLFAVIAKEEADIRANPAARGTELLRKVFSRQ